jgi:hypothetical protein
MPTFGNTTDYTPRRAADIWAGYNGGNWVTEYLAFGVGGAGDGGNLTTERMRIDGSGNITRNGRKVHNTSGAFYVSASGDNIFNLESLCGLFTSGLLYIRGNENGVNQTLAIYSFNLSYYGYSSNTRYCTLKLVHRNTSQNGYGDVYAYFSNYAASYTSGDQAIQGTATSTTDIYFRNAVGQGCIASYSLYVQG